MRDSGRNNSQLRDLKITGDFCPAAHGSVLLEMGNTRLICAASVGDSVPDHAVKRGTGWITAEYCLLPYSTPRRTGRDLYRRDGRSVEIQRLIARALRSVVDLSAMQNCLVTVDCDVLQADGGTRAAAITGGYIALARAVKRMRGEGLLAENPLRDTVAAVSVGYVSGELFLDLDFREDSRAEVDMNVVMDGASNLIEVQGTAEKKSFTKNQMDSMIELAEKGIRELMEIQKKYI
ncbi:MAG TPA: ribonuclease PH [Spirochaetota bacterium]|nr:ribonuclease PH [Spirochaetota bacterium]HPC41799.1 ribonuclease PH [Spirochaetota bacterium]HPL16137.1 ribonuclease PH [Spirochaetota bacterium]HQF07521.1 ribonuclease PH [Spirochaetota bacterium]HQH96252.1 ribonuclease PH [Spirochaetota bacterium]